MKLPDDGWPAVQTEADMLLAQRLAGWRELSRRQREFGAARGPAGQFLLGIVVQQSC